MSDAHSIGQRPISRDLSIAGAARTSICRLLRTALFIHPPIPCFTVVVASIQGDSIIAGVVRCTLRVLVVAALVPLLLQVDLRQVDRVTERLVHHSLQLQCVLLSDLSTSRYFCLDLVECCRLCGSHCSLGESGYFSSLSTVLGCLYIT